MKRGEHPDDMTVVSRRNLIQLLEQVDDGPYLGDFIAAGDAIEELPQSPRAESLVIKAQQTPSKGGGTTHANANA